MSKSTPSLLALLGLVAIAGYQNRDRIGAMLADAKKKAVPGEPAGGGFLAEVDQYFQHGGPASGPTLSSALGDLVERFRSVGRGDTAQSWVSTGANKSLNAEDLEATLGDETLEALEQKTGLGRAELLQRLNVALPEVVDRLTPHGRLPRYDETQNLV